jgi:hypothetical protein
MSTATKQQFRAILQREFAKYPWANDPQRYANAMAEVDRTLSGAKSCALTESWALAWKELGLKGKRTYKGLHALPECEAA